MARKIASAAQVRSFVSAQGIDVKPGRLSAQVIDAFNKGQKEFTYTPGVKPAETVKVTAMRTTESGRRVPVTKNVSVSMVRAAAAAAGVELGSRGRVSSLAQQATVTGDWSAFRTDADAAIDMTE